MRIEPCDWKNRVHWLCQAAVLGDTRILMEQPWSCRRNFCRLKLPIQESRGTILMNKGKFLSLKKIILEKSSLKTKCFKKLLGLRDAWKQTSWEKTPYKISIEKTFMKKNEVKEPLKITRMCKKTHCRKFLKKSSFKKSLSKECPLLESSLK